MVFVILFFIFILQTVWLFISELAGKDLDLAMTKGVNYPKGLIAWGTELGLEQVAWEMKKLASRYGEDRYRLSPALNDSL